MRCFSSVIPDGSSLFSVDYVVRSFADNRDRKLGRERQVRSGRKSKSSFKRTHTVGSSGRAEHPVEVC